MQSQTEDIDIVISNRQYQEILEDIRKLEEANHQLKIDQSRLLKELQTQNRPSDDQSNSAQIIFKLSKKCLKLSQSLLLSSSQENKSVFETQFEQMAARLKQRQAQIDNLKYQYEGLLATNEQLTAQLNLKTKEIIELKENYETVKKKLVQKENQVKNWHFIVDEQRKTMSNQKRLITIEKNMLEEKRIALEKKIKDAKEFEEGFKQREVEREQQYEKKVASIMQFSSHQTFEQQKQNLEAQLKNTQKQNKELINKNKKLEKKLEDNLNRIEYLHDIIKNLEMNRQSVNLQQIILINFRQLLEEYRQKLTHIGQKNIDWHLSQKKNQLLVELSKNISTK